MQDKNESQLILGDAAALSDQTAKKARVRYFIDQTSFPGTRLRCNTKHLWIQQISSIRVIGSSMLEH